MLLNQTLDVEEGREAAKRLGHLGEPGVQPLLAMFEGDKQDGSAVEPAAERALVEMGDYATEPLHEAVNDKNWHLRFYAIDVLGQRKDDTAVEMIIGCLSDENLAIRRIAAQSLGEIGDPRAIEPLRDAIRTDGVEAFRDDARDALNKIEDGR